MDFVMREILPNELLSSLEYFFLCIRDQFCNLHTLRGGTQDTFIFQLSCFFFYTLTLHGTLVYCSCLLPKTKTVSAFVLCEPQSSSVKIIKRLAKLIALG